MTGGDPDAATGLPLLKTWPAVYAFVAVVVTAYVAGLAALSGLWP